jgi:hypothetical protein
MRDPVECVKELIGNPLLAQQMRYAPMRVHKPGPGGLTRIYSEMWMADWWWQTQVSGLGRTHPVARAEPPDNARDIVRVSCLARAHALIPYGRFRFS